MAASELLEEGRRRQLSAAIAVGAALALASIGIVQLAKDGSFWIDEAAVAQSLLELSPSEMFGRLEGGQSFPRFLLVATSLLTKLFGYTTLAARALPHTFFLLCCAGWMRLVYLRFRDEPALVALAPALLSIPATPFVYAALLKPYGYDAALALLPFLLREDFYEGVIGRGERVWRGVALTACVGLSYPFAMALLARLGGWWLARATRGELRLAPSGLAAMAGGLAAFGAGLWLTDLRHTSEIADVLDSYWGACVVGSTEGNGAAAIVDRMVVGWWAGKTEFSRHGGFEDPWLMAIRLAVLAGFASIGIGLFARRRTAWGSRSLGCAGLLGGLPVASFVAGYPICAGRLTLFALLPLVIVVLEGLAGAAVLLRRLPFGSHAAAVLGVALVLAVLPTSVRDAQHLIASPAPMDLRPLLALTRTKPELPILTNVCTRKMLETLPEGLEVPLLVGDAGFYEVALSESREAWLVITPMSYCATRVRRTRLGAEIFDPYHEEGANAHLYHLRLADPHGWKKKRRRR